MFESEGVERLIREHQRGAADNSGKLWALIQLELWFRTYIDVEPKGPITLDFAHVISAPDTVYQTEP